LNFEGETEQGMLHMNCWISDNQLIFSSFSTKTSGLTFVVSCLLRFPLPLGASLVATCPKFRNTFLYLFELHVRNERGVEQKRNLDAKISRGARRHRQQLGRLGEDVSQHVLCEHFVWVFILFVIFAQKNEMRVAPEEHYLVVLSPPHASKQQRSKVIQTMYETFNTPAMLLVNSNVAALYPARDGVCVGELFCFFVFLFFVQHFDISLFIRFFCLFVRLAK
jgi:hypothetical protein